MGQRSILVVEDEPLIAMMLEDFLESLGHSVTATCESVEDAMAEADKGGSSSTAKPETKSDSGKSSSGSE